MTAFLPQCGLQGVQFGGRGWLIHPPPWVTRQGGIYEARHRRRSLAPLIRRIISLGPTVPRVSPTPDDYYAIKMWRLVRRPLNYKGLIDPIDPTECTPPSPRERERERVAICCTRWLFGLGFESHHRDPKFMHLLGEELRSTLLFVTITREHVSRVSCIVHFVRSIWLIRTRHQVADVSRCIRGLWYSWLDQLNSGVLIQRDLTRVSRYTCIIRYTLMYMLKIRYVSLTR